jgi:hypothetical protein
MHVHSTKLFAGIEANAAHLGRHGLFRKSIINNTIDSKTFLSKMTTS